MTDAPWRLVARAGQVLPLIVYRGAAGGVPVLIGFFIASQWGLAELGSFTVASAVNAIVLILTDFGGARLLPRHFAVSSPEESRSFVANANGGRFALTAVVVFVGWLVATTSVLDPRAGAYLAILLPVSFLMIVGNNAISERVVTRAVFAIGPAVFAGTAMLVASAVIARSHPAGGLIVAAGYLAGKVVETLVLLAGRWWVAAVRLTRWRVAMLALWPFSVQAVLAVCYSRVPVFVIERFGSAQELGILGAASGLQAVLLLLPSSLSLMLYPRISIAVREHAPRDIRRLVTQYVIVSLAGSLAGVGLLALLFEPVARFLHLPPESRPFVLAWVALSAFSVATMIAGTLLQAHGGEAIAARLSAWTLGASVFYQAVLVQVAGLWGLVFGLALAEITTLLIFIRVLRRMTRSEAEALAPAEKNGNR